MGVGMDTCACACAGACAGAGEVVGLVPSVRKEIL